MAQGRKIPDHVRERARELYRQRGSLEETRRALAAEGHVVSTPWLSLLGLARHVTPPPTPAPPVTPPLPAPAPTPDPLLATLASRRTEAPEPEALEGPDAPDAPPHVVALAMLARLERMMRVAERETNMAALANLTRASNAVMVIANKMRPPEPPKVEERPDMLAAAARCRKELHRLVERAVLG